MEDFFVRRGEERRPHWQEPWTRTEGSKYRFLASTGNSSPSDLVKLDDGRVVCAGHVKVLRAVRDSVGGVDVYDGARHAPRGRHWSGATHAVTSLRGACRPAVTGVPRQLAFEHETGATWSAISAELQNARRAPRLKRYASPSNSRRASGRQQGSAECAKGPSRSALDWRSKLLQDTGPR